MRWQDEDVRPQEKRKRIVLGPHEGYRACAFHGPYLRHIFLTVRSLAHDIQARSGMDPMHDVERGKEIRKTFSWMLSANEQD